ncbi:hypothetical protein GGI12_002069 [Dipsacomyces acuminosporus]|nr:hypothetical protein GGI12_002069 [Dipsacomyces acuminosporus]
MDLGFYVPELAQNRTNNDQNSNSNSSSSVAKPAASGALEGGNSAQAAQQPSLAEIAAAQAASPTGALQDISPLQQPMDLAGLVSFASVPGYTTEDAFAGITGEPQNAQQLQTMAESSSISFQQQQQQRQRTASGAAAKASANKQASGSAKDGAPKPIGMACRACRLRKIRCGGERPRCSYCVKKGYECVLTPHKKRGRPRKNEQRQKQQQPQPQQRQSILPNGETAATAAQLTLQQLQQQQVQEIAPQNSLQNMDMQQFGLMSSGSMGMRAMTIPADPVSDDLLNGLDLNVQQLWAELTGLQDLDLPSELSALVANSATQLQDANPSSIPTIGPNFNLGITMPGMSAGIQLPQQPQIEDSLLFASNYAFPRIEGDSALSTDLTTPPPVLVTSPAAAMSQLPVQQQADVQLGQLGNVLAASPNRQQLSIPQQQQQYQQQRADSPASSAHLSFTGDGMLGLTKATMDDENRQGNSNTSRRTGKSVNAARNSQPQSVPARGSIPVTQSIDEGIKMYFTYVHPWLPILHRPTFERQVLDGEVEPILYYAVQAIAARFKESDLAKQGKQARKPHKRGQRYARAASMLLPEVLKNARLATLQAITILALYMSISGHWQEGAAYEKLAVQLAFIGQYHLLDEEFLLPPVTNNMGLYETGWSEHSHPARLEVLSRPGGILEHEQRRRAWWSIFQLERFNGLAMGRPPIIKPGWHWVWLPCSEELWERENPSGPLAWEMGLADYSERPTSSVSNSRVDLILALIMGQMVEQRTEMFRLFFPRVDRGTLFYDNLPTHSMGWNSRLRRLTEVVGGLERRVKQWHDELDRYSDTFSARRNANFVIVGASCQIHLYACVLQIREHLFEDLIVSDEAKSPAADTSGDENAKGASGADTPGGASAQQTATESSATANPDPSTSVSGSAQTNDSSLYLSDANSSRKSSIDLAAVFEHQTGKPFEKSTYQRGYMAKAKRPELTLQFVNDLDALAQKCWDRSVAMSDEIARLLRLHWLRPFEKPGPLHAAEGRSDNPAAAAAHPVKASIFDETVTPDTAASAGAGISSSKLSSWTLGGTGAGAQFQKQQRRMSSTSGSSTAHLDPHIADRFKLMNPQTPYHLFVAGKVQTARLKQAVTAQARKSKRDEAAKSAQSSAAKPQAMDVDEAEPSNAPTVVEDAVRKINDIWDEHGLGADVKAVETRLDDIISALEYCQLFWFSLNFASHLKYLKKEASKPLLHSVYRD